MTLYSENIEETPKYICSEIAVKKILESKGVSPDLVQISDLKRCESLENMKKCANKILALNDINLRCNLYHGISSEYLSKNTTKDNPIAVRVVNCDEKNCWLHTVNVIGTKYNYYGEPAYFNIDEENNEIITKSIDAFEKWRYSDYAFMCKRF